MIQLFQNFWDGIKVFFECITDAFTWFVDAINLLVPVHNIALTYFTSFGPVFTGLVSCIITFSVIWLLLKIIHG